MIHERLRYSGNSMQGGMIGCGYFAQFQIDGWRRMPEVDIVAAADPDIARAQSFAPRAYSSAEEMLEREKLDFVDIATRPEWHLPLVKLAASHGIPVICQKPMAPNWQEAAAMVDAAAGVRLMIHENWRWQPWYREAKRIIASGRIGAPVAYWMRTRRRDGLGPEPYKTQPYFRKMPRLLLYETIVHHIDTARYLFGEIETVYAQLRRVNPVIAGEDQVLLTAAHESGVSGVIDGNRFTDPIPDGPVMGDAAFEGDEAELSLCSSGDLYIGGEKVWANNVTEGYRGDSVRATQQHFIDCLKSGAPFESGGEEYLRKTYAAVEAGYRSAAEKRAVSPTEKPWS